MHSGVWRAEEFEKQRYPSWTFHGMQIAGRGLEYLPISLQSYTRQHNTSGELKRRSYFARRQGQRRCLPWGRDWRIKHSQCSNLAAILEALCYDTAEF